LDKTVVFARHEVLNTDDAAKILDQYKVERSDLPKIRKADPALKGLEYKIGDIIRITRKSATAGQSLYYRVVVD
jgi:DNA-directed RNA polymerase subunit H